MIIHCYYFKSLNNKSFKSNFEKRKLKRREKRVKNIFTNCIVGVELIATVIFIVMMCLGL